MSASISRPNLAHRKTFALDARHGTATQYTLVRMALDDLNAAIGCDLARVRTFKVAPPRWLNIITFEPNALRDESEHTIGMTWYGQRLVKIAFRPNLYGAHLYATVMHELGHAYGLSHSRRRNHVMFWKDVDDLAQRLGPTPEQRAKWSSQIASSLHGCICVASVVSNKLSAHAR